MNQEVIRVVLANKRDVWRSPDLFDLVEGYFDSSLRTLDFLATLDASLRRARDVQLPLHLALQRLHQRDAASDVQKPHAPGAPDRYARSLVELRRFKEAGEPFTAELSAAFEAVYAQQLAMMSKIRQQKRQLDRSIRSVRSWRRASSVVFVATFAVLLVCSVVASAIASPPVAAALAAAASLPVGSMVDLSLKRYQEAHHGYKEVVGKMQVQAFIAVEDLDNIRVRVDRLAVQVSSMVDCIERTEREEEAVRVGIIEEVKMKLETCMEGVDDLRDQADRCNRDIRRARIVVLQKIIHPKS